MKDFIKALVETIILFLVSFILCPLLVFFISYIGGFIISLVIGTPIVNGLNLVFNTTRFTKDSLPLIFSTIAVVTCYFAPSSVNKYSK